MKYVAVFFFASIAIGWATPAAKVLVIHNANSLIDEINHATDLTVDSSDQTEKWLGYRTERGGLLRIYRRQDSVRKIIAELYHAFGMVRMEFYYEHEAPVFMYMREDYYPMKKDSTLNTNKLVFGHDAHFYVSNRTLVETKKRGKDKYGKVYTPEETLGKLLLMSDRWVAFR